MEPQLEVFRFENAYMTPGFIDTHIHGAGGFDCSSLTVSPNPIDSMSRILAERGVTSFFPTVVAAPAADMLENLSLLAAEMSRELPGAEAVGINSEGPFINPFKRGAQQEESILPIDLGFARELIEAGQGKIRVMTFDGAQHRQRAADHARHRRRRLLLHAPLQRHAAAPSA